MNAFRVITIPPPIRDYVVSQVLRTSRAYADTWAAYEKAVKCQEPRDHLISQLRLLNTRHSALVDVLTDLTRYNDQIRANVGALHQLERDRFLGRVAQA